MNDTKQIQVEEVGAYGETPNDDRTSSRKIGGGGGARRLYEKAASAPSGH